LETQVSEQYHFDALNRDGTLSLKYDARQATFGRPDVMPLWVADMDFATAPAISHAVMARAKHPIFGYSHYPNSLFDALINWVNRRHHWQIEREWIVMCPGVVPSIYAAVKALTAENESIIVQPPVYFPFFSAATETNRRLLNNPLQLANGQYQIDFAHFAQCAATAKLLLLCSPHNPVGRVWQQDELKQLLNIAQQNQLTIFSDEVHADIVYPPNQHIMLAKLAADTYGESSNIITAISPSKTFNLAGLNLSVLIVPNAAHRQKINAVFESLHINAANPLSIVGFEAAYSHADAWHASLINYLTQTRDLVANYLAQHCPHIKLVPPQGTYLCWLDCQDLQFNDAQLKDFFVNKAGVGCSQGIQFGAAGSGFMRMNIGTSQQNILKALTQIKNACDAL
jgi:cysteine-S-conjugate beta-lyase